MAKKNTKSTKTAAVAPELETVAAGVEDIELTDLEPNDELVAVVATEAEGTKRGPGRPKVDPNESPEERTKRLVDSRMDQFFVVARRIGNVLSNRSRYTLTQEQVNRIYAACVSALDAEFAKFAPKADDPTPKFEL